MPASSNPPIVLRAVDLVRTRQQNGREQAILRGVSLDVQAGSFVTIMGKSGSGKSTLLHLLAGLEPPSAGDIRVAGQDLLAGDEEHRARMRRERIGFIFQFFHLLPDLTVQENINLPLRLVGARLADHAARLDSLLALLGISQLKDRLPNQLSGGEMQRVSIARALASQPPILLADEPTGNLSSKAGEEVINLLRSVCDRLGTAILLVTHNPRDACAGDRVLFLHDGDLLPRAELTGGPFDAAVVFARLQELGI